MRTNFETRIATFDSWQEVTAHVIIQVFVHKLGGQPVRSNVIQIQKWPHAHPPTETELQQLFQKEGLTPHQWSNAPGDVYNTHVHSYHKVIYVVSGSIIFGFPIEGQPTTLYPGDRLDLPAGIPHNAAVGSEGVVCLEAHK